MKKEHKEFPLCMSMWYLVGDNGDLLFRGNVNHGMPMKDGTPNPISYSLGSWNSILHWNPVASNARSGVLEDLKKANEQGFDKYNFKPVKGNITFTEVATQLPEKELGIHISDGKKKYVCDCCNRPIKKGEDYQAENKTGEDGEPYYWIEHTSCSELVGEFDTLGLLDCGYYTSDDFSDALWEYLTEHVCPNCKHWDKEYDECKKGKVASECYEKAYQHFKETNDKETSK